MTFEIGEDGRRTEPLVRASVTMNVPIFKCTNPNCKGGLYGTEAEEVMNPIRELLLKHAKLKE